MPTHGSNLKVRLCNPSGVCINVIKAMRQYGAVAESPVPTVDCTFDIVTLKFLQTRLKKITIGISLPNHFM